MAATLILLMGLFLFTACGAKQEDQKSDGSQSTVSQEQQTGDDTSAKDETGDKVQSDEKTQTADNTATDKTSDSTTSTKTGETSTTKNGDSTTDKADTSAPDTTPASTCTIQINCSLLAGQDLSKSELGPLVPSNGMILPTTKVTIQPGDTVYDVTLRTVKAKKIQMSTQGNAASGTLYVEAIANIYEQAYNVKSGWVYLVNGTKPAVSCGLQKIKANDKLVWAYSLNFGNDL